MSEKPAYLLGRGRGRGRQHLDTNNSHRGVGRGGIGRGQVEDKSGKMIAIPIIGKDGVTSSASIRVTLTGANE